MIDPLAEMVSLLQPQAAFSKRVCGSGHWRVHRTETGQPFYCVVLDGSCQLVMAGREPVMLEQGDFILVPAAWEFYMTSAQPPADEAEHDMPTMLAPGEFWVGPLDGSADVQSLIGYCQFGAPDAVLLVSLLPQFIHIRGESRLTTLVQLVVDECRAQRPARQMVLERLLEVLLIEALRTMPNTHDCPGVIRALADERLSAAIREIHGKPAQAWTVAQLARVAALSRSAFFVRFREAVGVAPMVYLLTWRMALAKNLLREKGMAVGEVAERVGYRSASAFSVAFTRYVGMSPTQFA
ncbi:AraC family transcriptional regulator [Erwiniaceae bacterium L1_54_6]|nr:AraC family transcriptional regulator [Erwiniaceae bacterium L1_54_6]